MSVGEELPAPAACSGVSESSRLRIGFGGYVIWSAKVANSDMSVGLSSAGLPMISP